MEDVTEFIIGPLKEPSIYMNPLRICYTQAGKKKFWDLMLLHDSVHILLFNITRNKLIFVKQFRPAVYFSRIPKEERENVDVTKYDPKLGISLELCAGIVDKEKSLAQIAREEVLEECGYDVPLENLSKIIECVSPGATGTKLTFYYCEVTDDMKVSEGGGIDDEIIEVVEVTVSELKKIISTECFNGPTGSLFAMHWFLLNKQHHC